MMMQTTRTGSTIRRLGGATSVLISITGARAGEQFRWALDTSRNLSSGAFKWMPKIIASPTQHALTSMGDASTAVGRHLIDTASRSINPAKD